MNSKKTVLIDSVQTHTVFLFWMPSVIQPLIHRLIFWYISQYSLRLKKSVLSMFFFYLKYLTGKKKTTKSKTQRFQATWTDFTLETILYCKVSYLYASKTLRKNRQEVLQNSINKTKINSVDSRCCLRTLKRKKKQNHRILLQTLPQLKVNQQQNTTRQKNKKEHWFHYLVMQDMMLSLKIANASIHVRKYEAQEEATQRTASHLHLL